MTLADAIATPDGKRRYVRTLFSTIADRYDLITVVLSYGQDQRWKRRLVDLVGPVRKCDRAAPRPAGARSGDRHRRHRLPAGRGRLAGRWPRRHAPDDRARARKVGGAPRDRTPRFLVGDMLALPFPDGSFDVVTAGYGLRNVPDLRAAVDEIHRVLKTGGQALSLDFNRPGNPIVRRVPGVLAVVGGLLGWILHRDADTYRYIPASIRNLSGSRRRGAPARGARVRPR